MVFKKSEYNFIKFIKSNNKKHKYKSILQNKQTNKYVSVNFGGSHKTVPYRDTALKLYEGNYDTKKQTAYKNRTKNKNLDDWTPARFTWTRLYSLELPK